MTNDSQLVTNIGVVVAVSFVAKEDPIKFEYYGSIHP